MLPVEDIMGNQNSPMVETKIKGLDVSVAQPTPRTIDVIEVKVGWDADNVFPLNDYATLLVDQVMMSKPQLMALQGTGRAPVLEVGEVINYLTLLLKIRVAEVNGGRTRKHILKQLLIPSFFQTLLSLVGKIRIAQLGLEIVPVWANSTSQETATSKQPEIKE
jgi:hypothetical protein